MTWAIFRVEHLRAIGEIISAGSGTVAAILGGVMLDDTLRRTLSERLRNDKNIASKLLKVNGALGNTGPKIDLLYMLGAFDKPVRNALYGLSEIRNFFAHNLDASFDSQTKELLDPLQKLTLHEGIKYYPHRIYDEDSKTEIETIENNRDIFTVNLKLCLIALMRDRASHDMWSNKPFTKTALREQMRLWKRRERAHRELKKP